MRERINHSISGIVTHYTERFPIIAGEHYYKPPQNYENLQKDYQKLVPVGFPKEIGAVFLTDQADKIVLVFAACGDESSVYIPYQDALEVADLILTYRLNTIVKFHNHPEELVPVFSKVDLKIHNNAIWAIKEVMEKDLTPSRTLFLYDAVRSDWHEQQGFDWIGFGTRVVSPRIYRFPSSTYLNKNSQSTFMPNRTAN